MPRTTVDDRIAMCRPFVNRRATVQVKANNYSDDVITLTGTVLAIAARLKGTADFRGVQFDLVMHCNDGFNRVFALSRIVSIT